MSQSAGPDVDRLGERLHARLATVVADALGKLAPDQVPAPLRRLASFTPARRARLGGDRILGLAAHDGVLRGRLAVQARASLPEDVTDPSPTDGAVSLDTAALAWLERPEGWVEILQRAASHEQVRDEAASVQAANQRSERLRRRLEAAVQETKELRQKAKDDAEALRRDNAELRRTVGEARRAAERAGQEAELQRNAAVQSTEQHRGAQASSEAEVRRLRARLAELEQRLMALQRGRRADRDLASVRARLLLDAVVDAATGLKRELALPPAQGAPADLVAADEGPGGHRASSGAGSLPVEDPTLLAQLLAVPKAHLLVDGYNITKTAWPKLALDLQRERLLSGLAALVARTGAEVTVIFDAAESTSRPPVNPPRGVRVRFTPAGVIADDLIREFVAAEPAGRMVVVATSDREVVRDVTRQAGVHAVAARALVNLLNRG